MWKERLQKKSCYLDVLKYVNSILEKSNIKKCCCPHIFFSSRSLIFDVQYLSFGILHYNTFYFMFQNVSDFDRHVLQFVLEKGIKQPTIKINQKYWINHRIVCDSYSRQWRVKTNLILFLFSGDHIDSTIKRIYNNKKLEKFSTLLFLFIYIHIYILCRVTL